MPCDLAPMLQHHSQSMFEYLAPPRRPGGPHVRPQAQPAQARPPADVGYHDRVF